MSFNNHYTTHEYANLSHYLLLCAYMLVVYGYVVIYEWYAIGFDSGWLCTLLPSPNTPASLLATPPTPTTTTSLEPSITLYRIVILYIGDVACSAP